MSIHQIHLRYDAVADRLLLSVRTRAAEAYGVWLTRRMAGRLAAPLRQAVARLPLSRGPRAPGAPAPAIPVPEAQRMLEEVARERPLKDASFGEPFAGTDDATHPLGPEPLLPDEIDLRMAPAGGLQMSLREPRGRRLDLVLGDDLATGLSRLLDRTLAQTDWALPVPDAAEPPADAPAGTLN